jgi:hypothetical protein
MALPAPLLHVVVTRRCFHLAPAAIFSGPADYHAALDPPIDGLDLVLHPIEPSNDLLKHIHQLLLTDMPLIVLLVFLIMFRLAAMFVAFVAMSALSQIVCTVKRTLIF